MRSTTSTLTRILATRPVWPPLAVRLAAGAIYVGFGLGKFVDHESEAASFRFYGLPSPDAFTYLVGVVELGGGLLLLAGLLTRPAALLLAGNMVGVLAVAAPKEHTFINLGLAPALLLAMLYLVWGGGGRRSADAALSRRSRRARSRAA
jgi:putative oxidoreductase